MGSWRRSDETRHFASSTVIVSSAALWETQDLNRVRFGRLLVAALRQPWESLQCSHLIRPTLLGVDKGLKGPAIFWDGLPSQEPACW